MSSSSTTRMLPSFLYVPQSKVMERDAAWLQALLLPKDDSSMDNPYPALTSSSMEPLLQQHSFEEGMREEIIFRLLRINFPDISAKRRVPYVDHLLDPNFSTASYFEKAVGMTGVHAADNRLCLSPSTNTTAGEWSLSSSSRSDRRRKRALFPKDSPRSMEPPQLAKLIGEHIAKPLHPAFLEMIMLEARDAQAAQSMNSDLCVQTDPQMFSTILWDENRYYFFLSRCSMQYSVTLFNTMQSSVTYSSLTNLDDAGVPPFSTPRNLVSHTLH